MDWLERKSYVVYVVYDCLELITKEHNAKTCKQRLTCKTCENSYPTVLHGCNKKVRSDKKSGCMYFYLFEPWSIK